MNDNIARRMSTNAITIAAGSCCPALLVSGCHFVVGTGSGISATTPALPANPAIPKSDIEQITAQLIHAKAGGGPCVIKCPRDLSILLGATMQCVVTAQNGEHREQHLAECIARRFDNHEELTLL